MIKAFLGLLALQLAGVLLARVSGIAVPGTVLAFVMLFALLLLREDLYATLRPTAKGLLDNMALLFLPAAVGILQHLTLLSREGWQVIAALLLSQFVGMAATALTMNGIMAWQHRRRMLEKEQACHAV